MTYSALTNRNDEAVLIAVAALLTEVGLLKHPLRHGVSTQFGVEF